MLKKALLWKLLERFSVQGIQFVLQIVLARLLDPEHYGALSIIAVFTTLANVFIQTGFNTSLVQNKDVSEEDYSSVFWTSEGIAAFIYVVLYFFAPIIASFYKMSEITNPLRVMALILFPGALNAVQIAKISRELNFKKIFASSFGATLFSGVVGVLLARMGYGIWALVFQNLLNVILASAIMLYTVQWKPKFVLNLSRVKVLFGYGWKLLVSNLLENIYVDLRNLVIGKMFNSTILGYVSRGKQFPQFIMNATNEAVKTVMLPVLSKEQDNHGKIKDMTRTSILLSSFVIFPIMFGFAGIAKSLIEVLLTSKWLPCVIYMQIMCFTFAFTPINSCNLQAINAIGRSDIYLKLEVIKRLIGTLSIVVAIVVWKTPIAITATSLFMAILGFLINAIPNKRMINYSFIEQLKDIYPALSGASLMFLVVRIVELWRVPSVLTLFLQVLVGIGFYIGFSAYFKLKAFRMLQSVIKRFLKK